VLNAPRVSVVIPAYNAEPFIHAAMTSILAQTFTDFELLVADDGSTDATVQIAKSFSDPRVCVLESKMNLGPAAAQNAGLRAARGEYVAILGADDLALPERLKNQVAFLDAHSNIALVGTAVYLLMPDGSLARAPVPTDPIAVRWRLLFGNPIAAPAIMARRAALIQAGCFDDSIRFGEDMELWGRIAEQGKIAQLDEPLTKYRVHPSSLTRTLGEARRQWQVKIIKQNLARLTGIVVGDQVIESLAGFELNLPPTVVSEAHETIWNCARFFCASIAQQAHARKILFQEILFDLLRVARQDEAQRECALVIASHYAARYAPLEFASPHFLNFAAKIVAPPSWRRLFRRAAPRKANA
jgi:hypothetical protein